MSLQSSQVSSLFSILDKHNCTLRELQQQFLSFFNNEQLVFQALLLLNQLINANLLTHEQRIIAIFLLVQNYKSEQQEGQAFMTSLLALSKNTPQQFERQMIADLLVHGQSEQYAKSTVLQLLDQQEFMIDTFPQVPQIEQLRNNQSLQKITVPSSQSYICLDNLNSIGRNQNIIPLDKIQNLKQIVNQGKLSDLGVLRPVPDFIQIATQEANWLSPGLIIDLLWDNSADIEKKISRGKVLVKKGLEQSLSKDQTAQVQRILEVQPYAVLKLDFSEVNMSLLLQNNPLLVTLFLAKLSIYPSIASYLDHLLTLELSLNLIQVLSRLVKSYQIHAYFLSCFVLKNIRHLISCSRSIEKDKLALFFSMWLISFSKNELIDLKEYTEEINQLTQVYKGVQQVQAIKKFL